MGRRVGTVSSTDDRQRIEMPYAAFITLSFVLVIISWLRPRYSGMCGILLLCVAIFFAGLRGASNDYGQYVLMFRTIRASTGSLLHKLLLGKDPLFGLLILAIQSIGLRVQALFLAAATLTLCVKAKAFKRVFGSYTTPLFVLICTTYFLHEYTQIRVAIAVAFSFLGLIALSERRKLWWAIFSIVAIGFHISTLAVFLCEIPFALDQESPAILTTFVLGGLGTLAAMSHIFSVLTEIAARVSEYRYDTDIDKHGLIVQVFKAVVLLGLNYVLIRDERDLVRKRLWKICIVLEAFGIGTFLVLMTRMPAIGFRISELMEAFGVFAISGAIFRRSYLSWSVAFSYCVGVLVTVTAGDLLMPYVLSTHAIW